jgi:caa(3)-type oxidase subunit IV
MERVTPYRTYWVAWLVLLTLTVTMIVAEAALPARAVTVAVVVFAMIVKVTLIGAWYMHLRYERLALVASIVIGTFATAVALFALLVPDALPGS